MGFFSRKKGKPPQREAQPQVPKEKLADAIRRIRPPSEEAGKPPQREAQPQVSDDGLAAAMQRMQSEREDERTTFAVLPQFEGAALMPHTSGKLLNALKAQLNQLVIVQAASGIRHENDRYTVLPKTLRSAWMAKVNHRTLGEIRFLVGQTRSTWVVVYDNAPEKVYEDPRFMSVELKRRDIARTLKGKLMYVSLIGKKDLDGINAIAAQDAKGQAQPDTLAPTEGVFSLKDTMARLQRCKLGHCTDVFFDVDVFVANIRFMTPTQGDTGNYYYIEAGVENNPKTYELHVGKDPKMPEDNYEHKAVIYYEKELCFLYINVHY